ncbi:uncharacterized protein LOC124132622 [Haliotis rufescens]|uniref:uncharacterized protein LOC124132622 n=1 Tax=Haliotis rufescens TaxID=6454 RepID=UPI00201F1E68|nr:uncharacterized protein LOC124132622 [Haliotis rufescens]
MKMMVFPLLLMFINSLSVFGFSTFKQPKFKINAITRSKPGYVTELEEARDDMMSKQDQFDKDLKNVSARVDEVSGKLETTQSICLSKQEKQQDANHDENVNLQEQLDEMKTAIQNIEKMAVEKAVKVMEEHIKELKDSMLIQTEIQADKSHNCSEAIRSLEHGVYNLEIKSEETESILSNLTASTANLTEFVQGVLYKLSAYIGNVGYGESSDRVSIRIDGSLGVHKIHDINTPIHGKGEVNEVYFQSPRLGLIDSVHMQLHGSDGWYIEKVTIDELYTGNVFTFVYDAWLDDESGPMAATVKLTSATNRGIST